MGFLIRNIFILAASTIFLSGCAKSLISLEAVKDDSPYRMFGRQPERNFYLPIEFKDSLKLIWRNDAHGSFNFSSITVHNNYVFVSDLSGRIFAYNFETGKQIGMLRNKGAVYTAPVLHNFNLIYILNENNENRSTLYYYDFNLGKVVKEISISDRVLTEIINPDNSIIFNSESGKVYKYTLQGEQQWVFDTKVKTRSSPAVADGIIIFGNEEGETIALQLESGKLKYRNKIGGIFFSGVMISSGKAFIGNNNGFIYSIDLNSGNVIWKFDTGAKIIATPAADDNFIFIGNLKGEIYCVDKISGNLVWKTSTKGLINSTPLILKERIIYPDFNKAIHIIRKDDGKVLKSLEFDGRVKFSPIIVKNRLFIGYDDGKLEAYEIVN